MAKEPSKNKPKRGRNADGTFAQGNTIGNGFGGRPKEDMSFRHQVKLRAQKDPQLVQRAIDTLVEIALDKNHPKCVEALEKLIKLNGNYDPAESKTELSGKVEGAPFVNLSAKEVEDLLKKYDKR
ncbi:hypothetical protein IKD67_01705 [Candidatus Saccharibacteria bacterium]|nr:hypothetical protein [Candidatus Saccharibacteria bacterium]